MKPIQALGGITIVLLFGIFAFALVNFVQDSNNQQLEEEFSPVALVTRKQSKPIRKPEH